MFFLKEYLYMITLLAVCRVSYVIIDMTR